MSDISNRIQDFIIKVLFQLGALYKTLLVTYNLNMESTRGKKELHDL